MDSAISPTAKSLKATLREEMQRKRKQAQSDYLQNGSAQRALCDSFTALLGNSAGNLSKCLSRPLSKSLAKPLAEPLVKPLVNDSQPLCAGYFPMHSEIDPRPLMRIYAQKYANPKCASCLLPLVVGKQEPLQFRLYDGDDTRLEDGAFSTKHPAATAGVGEPTLLLVPLLAFDRNCKRLGYGGGFYDRSLAALREKSQVFALGIAYEAQLVASIPSEQHDLALDAVLTEQRVYAENL